MSDLNEPKKETVRITLPPPSGATPSKQSAESDSATVGLNPPAKPLEGGSGAAAPRRSRPPVPAPPAKPLEPPPPAEVQGSNLTPVASAVQPPSFVPPNPLSSDSKAPLMPPPLLPRLETKLSDAAASEPVPSSPAPLLPPPPQVMPPSPGLKPVAHNPEPRAELAPLPGPPVMPSRPRVLPPPPRVISPATSALSPSAASGLQPGSRRQVGPKKETARAGTLPDNPSAASRNLMTKTQPLVVAPAAKIHTGTVAAAPAPADAKSAAKGSIFDRLDAVPLPICWGIFAISAVTLLIQIWNYVAS